MTILLLKQLAVKGTESYLLDRHLAAIEQCREESTLMLRNFYKVRCYLNCIYFPLEMYFKPIYIFFFFFTN